MFLYNIFSKNKFLKYKKSLAVKIGNYAMSKIKSFKIDIYEDIFIINSIKK